MPGVAWEQWSGHSCLACLDMDNIAPDFSVFPQWAEEKANNYSLLSPQGLLSLRSMEGPEREFIKGELTIRTRTKTRCTPLGQIGTAMPQRQ